MKSVLQHFRNNLITYGTVIIITLMITSAILSFYNRAEMLLTTHIKYTAIELKIKVNAVTLDNMGRMDLSLRGYALTNQKRMLVGFDNGKKLQKENIERIENILKEQKLDTSIAKFKKLKIILLDYIVFCDQMKIALDKRDVPKFLEMLKEDRGWDAVKALYPFKMNIDSYEDKVISLATENYEKALNRTILIQLATLVLGLPILLIMLLQLRNENKNRKKLLLQLEKTNRQYLYNEGNEIDISTTKKVIENSIQNFIKANQFITHISEGNYDTKWEGLNNQNLSLNEDSLAGRLLKMRDEMKHVKMEDEKRNWTNEGLTKFSTIVRNNQNDLQILSDKSLLFLTKYLNAKQGSLFVVRRDKSLELTACYVNNKKKHLEKIINFGEGMIGQVYLEETTLVLKKIPDGYIEITSGETMPDCLMIIPLKYNDEVAAIVELAGYGSFEEHKVKFVEKAGEILAAAILDVETTQQMKQLLEEAQEQRQIMIAQEAEMKTYVQDLMATKEDMYRKIREMEEANLAMKNQLERNIKEIKA